MTLVPTPNEKTFPNTSEQSQQVGVSTHGVGFLKEPAGDYTFSTPTEDAQAAEVADSRDNVADNAAISEAQSHDGAQLYNPAGSVDMKATADSLQGGTWG